MSGGDVAARVDREAVMAQHLAEDLDDRRLVVDDERVQVGAEELMHGGPDQAPTPHGPSRSGYHAARGNRSRW